MIDLEKIRTIYKFGRNVSLKDIQVLIQAAKKQSFAPGAYLIKEGTLKRDVFFIRKGLVRTFIVNQKGDEITTSLRWENNFVMSPRSILFNEPSKFYLEAIEPTEVFSMDADVLQSIISKDHKLEANRKYFLRKELNRAFEQIDAFILLSPEERYVKFIQTNPDIVNRVPNKYIANVLGITPVSLSRIRKRLASKKKEVIFH